MAEVRLKISDIDCAACVGRVRRALAACPGVESAQVSYASGMAQICYDETKTDIAGIVKCVKSAGFGVRTETAIIKCADLTAAEAALATLDCVAFLERDEKSGVINARLWPVGADEEYIVRALGMAAEVTVTSAEENGGDRAKQTEFLRGIFAAIFFSLPQLWEISFAARLIFGALTLFAGAYFYKAAFRAIKKKVLSPDIAAAVILTAVYILCAAYITPFLMLTAVTVVLLLSRYAERCAVYVLGASARRLSHLQPKTAHVLQNGQTVEVSADDLRAGNIIFVLPGERIAADGEIVFGECTVDESAITGGSELVVKRVGDTVLCGSLDREGEVHIRIVRAGKNTVLQEKISSLGSAEPPRVLSRIAASLGMTAVFALIFGRRDGEK